MTKTKKILVIDDSMDMVKVIQMDLSAEGYDVITAFNGVEGLTQVESERPDLIILDVMMPQLDGFEFSKKIKSDARYKSIPIILLSDLIYLEGQQQSPDIADCYVAKPFESEKLLGAVKNLLEKA